MSLILKTPFKKDDGALVHPIYAGEKHVGHILEVFRDVFYVSLDGVPEGKRFRSFAAAKAAIPTLNS